MRGLVACSSFLVLPAFVIAFVITLFNPDMTWIQRLAGAGCMAATVFVAAFMLGLRDHQNQRRASTKVRKQLLESPDTSDKAFIDQRPTDEPELMIRTRTAIANFFDVPATKINRDVNLVADLQVNNFEPGFQFAVVDSVIAQQPVERRMFGFSMAGLETIDDLVIAIRRVLDDFEKCSDDVPLPK